MDDVSAVTLDPRYRPAIVYAREAAEMHTRICLYNYWSDLLPDRVTGATVRMQLFDRSGREVVEVERKLPFRGQLQLDLAELVDDFEGTAGVALLPDPPPLPSTQRWFSSGFYVRYCDGSGHLEMGHEWESTWPAPRPEKSYIQFVRPADLTSAAIVVINPYAGNDVMAGSADWRLCLRDASGAILTEQRMPAMPPRGSGRYALETTVADWPSLVAGREVVGVEAVGRNIAGPLSLLRHRNGDFSLHHF